MLRFLFIGFIGLFLFVSVASAARHCGDRELTIRQLAKDWEEFPISMALAKTGQVLETFISAGGKTYTMLLTQTNGRTCIVSVGDNWVSIAPPKAGAPS